MKYIKMLNEEGLEEIFTFPRSVNHDCMAEVLRRIKNQTHGSWKRDLREVLTAGFVNEAGECHGKSITLNVEASEKDTALLQKQLRQQI